MAYRRGTLSRTLEMEIYLSRTTVLELELWDLPLVKWRLLLMLYTLSTVLISSC